MEYWHGFADGIATVALFLAMLVVVVVYKALK